MQTAWFFIALLGLVQSSSFVDAYGNVGCLFSEELCYIDTERCIDDGAFGRCMPLQLDSYEEPYRHHLNEEELGIIEYELGRLLENGYRWSHRHTQCVLQSLLQSFQSGSAFDYHYCDNFQDDDLGRSLTSGDVDYEGDPRSWAQIKYSPNDYSPSPNFAKIIYYSGQDRERQEGVYGVEDDTEKDETYPLVRRSLSNDIKPIRIYSLDGVLNTRSRFEREDPKFQEMQDTWLESMGFMRKERLDVKKPGPPYDPAFENRQVAYFSPAVDMNDTRLELMDNVAFASGDGQKEKNSNFNKQITTKSRSVKKMVDDIANSEQYDVIDTTYTYIEFKNDINTWKEGRAIVDKVAELLKVPKELFSKERVDRNEVTFKVKEPNKFGLNGTEVAKKIENIKEELSRTVGVVITGTGIGDKSKLPSVEQLDTRPNHEVYVVTVIVCGVLAALALSAGVLYLTRRHSYKLANMTSADPESSKLYQDLCRARMSTKTSIPTEKNSADNTSIVPVQRIASLSKESDKESPSSRSSTSSWSEEPALTNMDISTGKVVLAHMEEHLKDPERLETEWSALCIYETDPSSNAIAQRSENQKKNRNSQALPYDHARVVLNELSNISESDYINASTIADHDPRNVAYIVTQGPLPHSVPDLWQMVWEQGCVVIVMLTRLGEPDAPLSHRYWPEDGSEIYHIYEVHLVGEYMWCDDYVVRSFYLKNMKTGETRTVTQFHYLSWPENGTPNATKPLLEFRRKVNKSFRGRSCPIVVHCSDGVGRSGTYVLLDMVLNRIAKGAKEIDVAATLEHIRDQRAKAVATKKQFQFVLQAVADEVQAILKVLQQQ